MIIQCQNDNYLNLATEMLEKIKNIREDRKVQFEAFNFDVITTFLYNCFTFPKFVSEVDARNIITKSIYNVADGEINPEKLKDELNSRFKEFLSRPIKRYVLVALISISRFKEFKNIYFGNDRLIFERYLSERFNNAEREKLINYASRSTPAIIPDDYSYCRVYVSSRSIYDAGNKALENLDLIRGIWNFIINRRSSYRKSFVGKPEPINKIILGPIHTLHYPDGNLACDKWWYEPNYFGQIKTYNPTEIEMKNIFEVEKNIRKRINLLNYQNEIKTAFIRYSKALDERDMTSAFLKLWGVLEMLTNTTKGVNYNITAKRVASLFDNRDLNYQILMILKEFRNSYVHFSKENEEPNEQETYLIQLKNYVERVLLFHLGNEFNFSSIQRVAEFFDITVDKREFDYKVKLLEYAKKFRHY